MSINQASKSVGAGKAEERDLLDKAPADIGWARWAWNPIVKAGDYEVSDEALSIPAKMAPPKDLTPPERNIFVCPAIDLFSGSIDTGSIKKVLDAVKTAPVGWNFIFLTRYPSPLTGLDWGRNCWVGVIVDNQKEARAAEEAFEKIGKQAVRFICCERRERLLSLHFKLFDWLVLRGHSEPDWGKTLIINAWQARCPLYLDSDLHARLQEYPDPAGR
jgi:protein gp37